MKKQQGFTLIELVIVVIILGLLGAAAVPRFLDATDDARDASVEGVAGGFASAVGLVRAEWELAGRPAGNTNISYDGISLDVTDAGYPASLDGNDASAASLNRADCLEVFSYILQSAPRATRAVADDYDGETYIVDIIDQDDDADGVTTNLCQYTLADGLEVGEAAAAGTQGFTYNADSGRVVVF